MKDEWWHLGIITENKMTHECLNVLTVNQPDMQTDRRTDRQTSKETDKHTSWITGTMVACLSFVPG